MLMVTIMMIHDDGDACNDYDDHDHDIVAVECGGGDVLVRQGLFDIMVGYCCAGDDPGAHSYDDKESDNWAVHTRENKPWITESTAYVQ